MNTLTIANPAQAPSPTPATGAPATGVGLVDGSEGMMDFAALLFAGIGSATEPAQAREPVDLTKDPVIDASNEMPACDPAALLDAIAAGKAGVDPQQLTVAPIAVQPMSAPPVLVQPSLPVRPSDSTALPVITRDSALAVRVHTEGGKGRSTAQADTQNVASSPRAIDAPHDEDTAPAAMVAPTAAHESTPVPVLKAELPERRQETVSQLQTVSSTPGHAATPVQSANAARVVAHVEQLAQPFGSPAWEHGFSSRVVWMARNDVQSAEIRLNPPDLGPIEVKLVLSGDPGAPASASVQFSAAHAATREAIESALPRLREMLQENGIALGNTTVDARTAGNTHGSGDSGRPSHGGTPPDTNAGQTPEGAVQPRPGSLLRRGNGLVDTFA